jgi:acetyl coenzyme A synthetase (ADP forming)-like protein
MSLYHLLSPQSIAVVGASTKPGSVGNGILKNLVAPDQGVAFSGKVYPVNPKASELFGLRCYANLTEIHDPIDLAVIIVPAASVPEVLKEAGRKNIPAAMIISSGFKETGEAGKILEEQVVTLCKEYRITLLGPNCLGFIHPALNLNTSFAPLMPEAGDIAFLSQSGALCTAILDFTHTAKVGFSKFISLGNKACLAENELLRHLAQDENTRVIGFYTEALENANNLIETGRAILARAQAKPIIALKAGLTQAGAAASASHTGSLGGSEAAYRALFTQSKMIQAQSLEELLNFMVTFSRNELPEGNHVAIITNAGGPGVMATDAAVRSGLVLAELSSETQEALKRVLPSAANTHNPVDVLGDAHADRYQAALDLVAADRHVDSILVILTPQTTTEIEATAQAIIDTKRKTAKPIVAVFAGDSLVGPGRQMFNEAKVAVLPYPEQAMHSLGALAKVAQWRKEPLSQTASFSDVDKEKVANIFQKVRQDNRTHLSEEEAWDVLSAYGFPVLRKAIARTPGEAQAAAESLSVPVALKIVSPDITHKSDAGGVLLNVEPGQVAEAYRAMMERVAQNVPSAKLEGVLVVEMAQSGGREIILGIKKEPGLGTMLMFGLGGIYVETFKDVAFRFTPLTSADIKEMTQEVKSLPLLTGARGQQGIDLDKLREYIACLSQLATDFPEIQELDINPLLTFPSASDFRMLDARITLQS